MDLQSELDSLQCQVFDADEARTATHREVLLILAQTFDYEGVALLCEPSVVGGRSGPPDVVIVDPLSGLHAVEVKGVVLDQVRAVKAGGAIEISYNSNISRKDPSRQAKQAMFDVKDASTRHFGGELHVPFQSWVVFPRIERSDWEDRFGEAVTRRADVLFSEDLDSSRLLERLQKEGVKRLSAFSLRQCPSQQLRSVMAAFGDSEVLRPEPRHGPVPREGSKGDRLSDVLAERRALTELQQRLTSSVWDDGPRLLRGVAGSGKTVVLATQAARMIERLHKRGVDLFGANSQPLPVLAVCFNRTLVPFIRQRVEMAYRQRTDEDLPEKSLLVTHFNTLMYYLNRRGLCGYYRIQDVPDQGERALRYLSDLRSLAGERRDRLSEGLFHGVYVDEGQDFHEHDYRVLLELCARTEARQPRMFVFYDDAQNLYGLKRPTWSDLGLELRGRSVVMDECFRNTQQIVEPAFNVLLGIHADDPQSVRTRSFADVQTLKEKGLIKFENRHLKVCFSSREGDPPSLRLFDNEPQEVQHIAEKCEQLILKESLLPQDILVLTFKRNRASQLAAEISKLIGGDRVRCPFEETEKDDLAIQPDKITVSTVASAKGYDAPYVILASVQDFPADVEGRVSFYVACTRAREWLDVNAVGKTDVVREFERSLVAAKSSGTPAH